MNRFRTLRHALLALSLMPSALLAADAADPVNRLHAGLTEAMNRSAKLGCEGRIQLLGPVVDDSFNLPLIAEKTLRRHWKTLDDAQHARFTTALRTSVVSTYATEFAKANSVRFETGKTDTLPGGDSVVHARLLPAEGDPVSLDYVLKQNGERWQIVNVLAEGVSDLALRATQYDGIIKGEGFDALVKKLDSQTQAQKARCS